MSAFESPMLGRVAAACVRLGAELRAAGVEPKATNTLATIAVRRMAFLEMHHDISQRTGGSPVVSDEVFIQVHNGYRVRVVSEKDAVVYHANSQPIPTEDE